MPNPLEKMEVDGRQVDPALVREIAELVVSSLNLEIATSQRVLDWARSGGASSRC